MNTADVAVTAFVGAMLGSFANVLIYRLPRDESIMWPGSRCPQCRTPIRAWDNIPLLSYVMLKGRCRACAAPISVRYPIVEGLMACLAAGVALVARSPLALAAGIAFAFLLLVITFIDLDHQLILNRITYPGIVAGLVVAFVQGRGLPALVAAVGAAGLIASIVILSRGGMGGGDVKLAGLMGAFLGWPGVAVGLFAGFMIGGVIGVCLLALKVRGRKDAIPFGPALAAGALVAFFWGDAVARWYWP